MNNRIDIQMISSKVFEIILKQKQRMKIDTTSFRQNVEINKGRSK